MMMNWLRKHFQRIFIPQDVHLRYEFEQFKKDVKLLIGENTALGVDYANKGRGVRGNTIIIVMSHQRNRDIVKHIPLDMTNSEVMQFIGYMRRSFHIKDYNIHYDGPPGYMNMMREEIKE